MSNLPKEPPSSEITPQRLYLSRREFMRSSALTLGTAAAVGSGLLVLGSKSPPPDQPPPPTIGGEGVEVASLNYTRTYDLAEAITPFKDVTTYNNFYEYGLEKSDPARNAHLLQTRDRKSTRLNSSHIQKSRMPSSA